MPTLAQILAKGRQKPEKGPFLVDIVSATSTVVTTVYGPVPNAIGVTPTTGQAVVFNVGGRDLAVGWIRP